MMPDLGVLDYVSRTVTISAVDGVGNRTVEPLVLSGWVDNVAPVLAASQVVSDVVLGSTTTVLTGVVKDGSEAGGGPTVDVSVRVGPPRATPSGQTRCGMGPAGASTWRAPRPASTRSGSMPTMRPATAPAPARSRCR